MVNTKNQNTAQVLKLNPQQARERGDENPCSHLNPKSFVVT